MTDHPPLDWTVQRNPEDTEVHVTPNHDLKPHTLDVQCACAPFQDNEHLNLFIHNSHDGRESYETGERKLS